MAFTSSTAHWSDVGGVVAGSLNCAARTHFEEGVRIPALTLYKRGVMNNDIVAILLANMRQSWERLGDLHAQVAAVSAGEERIRVVIAKHGVEAVLTAMAEIQTYSERMARAAFASLPDGRYESEDSVDQDVHTGEKKTIRLTLHIEGDHAIFDLTASDGAAESGINCTIAATTSAIFIGLAAILPPMPMNAGGYAGGRDQGHARLDCLGAAAFRHLRPGHHEHGRYDRGHHAGRRQGIAGTGGRGAVGDREFDVRRRRYAPTFDAPFINYIWAFGGTGGTKYKDGRTTSRRRLARPPRTSLRASRTPLSGALLATHALERLGRRRQDSRRLRPGSTGGASRARLPLQHHQSGEGGSAGHLRGGRGWTSRLFVNAGTESERNLGTFAVNVPVGPGEMLSFWSNGAGGYGDPLERSAEPIVEDIRDDYMTIGSAKSLYGVVIKEVDRRRLQYEVDAEETETLRRKMRAAR